VVLVAVVLAIQVLQLQVPVELPLLVRDLLVAQVSTMVQMAQEQVAVAVAQVPLELMALVAQVWAVQVFHHQLLVQL
jgi:hypothetical protein